MLWMVKNSVGSILGVFYRFVWENPIISFQLLSAGLLTMLYPQFCFKVFLSPVVVYTAFLLTALLSIGHRQQQEKDAAKIAKEPIHEVCHLTKESIHEETATVISSKECVEYVKERIVVEKVEEGDKEGFSIEDDEFGDSVEVQDGFVDGKEIHGRKEKNEIYGDEVMVPDFQRDYTKSVHFSDSVIEVYRTHLDVILEEGEEEEHSHAEDLTPRKIDTDDSEDDDDALLNVSPRSENKEDEDQRKVRLEDFFSLTLQSTWKTFGQGAATKNFSSDEDDDDDTDSSSEASGDSLGRLGPLVYEVQDPQQSHEKERNSPRESSSTGGESPVDFHFTWTEEDEGEEKESLFEIVHSGDAHSTSEEENLIEIALSDQENNPERQAIKGTVDHNHEEQPHQEKDIKPHGAEEENLIEIDLSAEKNGLQEEKNQVQKEVSDLTGDDSSAHKEDSTSITESKVEEIKASEESESGKNCEENHEIQEALDSPAGS